MDDELEKLEAELQRLRPRVPAPRLLAGLERRLVVPRPARSVRLSWFALPLAAAAALALIYMLAPPLPTSPATIADVTPPAPNPQRASGLFEPVAAEDLLLNPRAESLVTLADGTVARRTRESYLATITWKNPRTNASLTWRVPREEVRVVPVSYQ